MIGLQSQRSVSPFGALHSAVLVPNLTLSESVTYMEHAKICAIFCMTVGIQMKLVFMWSMNARMGRVGADTTRNEAGVTEHPPPEGAFSSCLRNSLLPHEVEAGGSIQKLRRIREELLRVRGNG